VLGKSLVVYATKPVTSSSTRRTATVGASA